MKNEPVSACHDRFHKVVFENEFARFFFVELPPGEATQMHRHDTDYYVVIVGDADIEDTAEGHEARRVQYSGGDTVAGKKGHVHQVKNVSPQMFRNVGIELK